MRKTSERTLYTEEMYVMSHGAKIDVYNYKI